MKRNLKTGLEAAVPDTERSESTVGTKLGHWMEEMLTRAVKQGDFDDLPGHGKPLRMLEKDPFAGPEADAYRILKEAGFTPEWIELRKQISVEVAWLRANPTHPERISRIVETNVLIDRHNRAVPNPSFAYPKLGKDFGQE